jgi:hypothetical protein
MMSVYDVNALIRYSSTLLERYRYSIKTLSKQVEKDSLWREKLLPKRR